MSSPIDNGYDDNEEVIVIPKSWLVTAGMSLLMLVIGGAAGYFLALTSFERGAQVMADQVLAGVDTNPPAAAQVQPTPAPARLDDVSEDDDPAIGPENAPVVIVEFSDFR